MRPSAITPVKSRSRQLDRKRATRKSVTRFPSGSVVDFDRPGEAGRRGYCDAILTQTLQMELDSLLDQLLHFVSRVANRDHTWKIRNVRSPGTGSLLEYHRVCH